MAGSAFTYRQNISTHGPPTSSAVLANLGRLFITRLPAKRVRNATNLALLLSYKALSENWLPLRVPSATSDKTVSGDIVNRSRKAERRVPRAASQIRGLHNPIAKPCIAIAWLS